MLARRSAGRQCLQTKVDWPNCRVARHHGCEAGDKANEPEPHKAVMAPQELARPHRDSKAGKRRPSIIRIRIRASRNQRLMRQACLGCTVNTFESIRSKADLSSARECSSTKRSSLRALFPTCEASRNGAHVYLVPRISTTRQTSHSALHVRPKSSVSGVEPPAAHCGWRFRRLTAHDR